MLVMAESTKNTPKWIRVDEEPDIDNEVEHDEDWTVTKILFLFFFLFFLSQCLFSDCVCFKDANNSNSTSSMESGRATASSSSGISYSSCM